MGEAFLGSEALAGGALTRHELQRWYRPIFRGVYVPKRNVPSLRDRTLGAWLASRRQTVIAGVAASALHGAEWVDADCVVEAIGPNVRPQRGLLVRHETLADDEVALVDGLPVTTPARTAFDLGRHQPRVHALARLDALMRATPFSVEDVLLIAKRYEGARGVRQLRSLLPLVDGGAASPKESWLRQLFMDAGFPKPTTQIPVYDGWQLIGLLDMGWDDFKIAAEYDGDQHRTNRTQYVKDLRRIPRIERLGWIHIRVIAEDYPGDILDRAYRAMVSRGWKP